MRDKNFLSDFLLSAKPQQRQVQNNPQQPLPQESFNKPSINELARALQRPAQEIQGDDEQQSQAAGV